MIKCCNGCAERTMGCHGGCERYAVQKAKHDAVMAAKRKILSAEDDTTEYFVLQARKRRH